MAALVSDETDGELRAVALGYLDETRFGGTACAVPIPQSSAADAAASERKKCRIWFVLDISV